MIEMILASMAGFWLGLYLLVVFGSLIWASETDSFFMGIGVLVLAWAIGEWALGIPILASIVANPLMLIVYGVLYITLGAVYVRMWKLPNFVNGHSTQIQESYMHWSKEQQRDSTDWRERTKQSILGTTADEKSETKEVDISYETFLNSSYYKYSVKNNKDRVASWVLLWPASITWELSHKPFVWIWNKVYYGLGQIFEKANHDMAKKILEGKDK